MTVLAAGGGAVLSGTVLIQDFFDGGGSGELIAMIENVPLTVLEINKPGLIELVELDVGFSSTNVSHVYTFEFSSSGVVIGQVVLKKQSVTAPVIPFFRSKTAPTSTLFDFRTDKSLWVRDNLKLTVTATENRNFILKNYVVSGYEG